MSAYPQDFSVSYDSFQAQEPIETVPIYIPKNLESGGPRPSQRRKPSLGIRAPLQVLSLLLSAALLVCLLTTALLIDCNRMISAGGIKQMVHAIFSSVQPNAAPIRPMLGAVGTPGHIHREKTSSEAVGNIEIPVDVLTSGDADVLVDWLCDVASSMLGEEVEVDREQLSQFVSESTFTDYLAEKAAGYAEDFINDTKNTMITADELMALLEENEALIEATFQVELSEEAKDELSAAIQQTIVQNDLNNLIHEEMFSAMEESIESTMTNTDMATIRSTLQLLTSDELMLGAIAVCIALMLLLCGLNFYNVPAGITWAAIPCIIAGGVLSVPIALLQVSPALLVDILMIPASLAQIVISFLGILATVHYGLLILGVILLVLSIVWRIVRVTARPANVY